jgi:hypothetical protein
VSSSLPSPVLFEHFPHYMDPSGSPQRLPSPTPTHPPSTSRRLKSETQTGRPFAHPFESDLRSPGLSSYEDPSPPLADPSDTQYQRKEWWDELLDNYASTREQAYVIHLSHSNRTSNECRSCP